MSSDGSHVLDTVVLLYFLLADEEELLGELIGWPFRVPFAVYDPEERAMPLQRRYGGLRLRRTRVTAPVKPPSRGGIARPGW